MPALDNYDSEENVTYDGHGKWPWFSWWSAEEAAWACNQSDDCPGFLFKKSQGYGGWFMLTSGSPLDRTKPIRNGDANTYRAYYKKSNSWRKASNPDTSKPSILPNPKSALKLWEHGAGPQGGDCVGSGTKWELNKPGIIDNGGGGGSTGQAFGNDRISGYSVPLGWKVVLNENGWYGNGNTEGASGPFCGSNFGEHGMNDKTSSGILENVGFDVQANWSTMGSQYVHPDDEFEIKKRYCKQSIDILGTLDCNQFYQSSRAQQAGLSYNSDVYEFCRNDPNWFNRGECRTNFNSILKGNNQTSIGEVTAKVRSYCEGAGMNDAKCGCYNATRFGAACYNDASKRGLPGCAEMYADAQALPSGTTIAINDSFCMSSTCASARSNDNVLLAAQVLTCPSVTMAFCVNDFRNAKLTGSPVSTTCQNNIQITTPAPPPPPPPPTTPPPGTPPTKTDTKTESNLLTTNETVVKFLDTRDKQMGAIVCCVCLILIMFMLAMSGGGSGPSGPSAGEIATAMASGKAAALGV